MLVLTRRPEESVVIAGSIELTVLEIRGEQVSLGFRAPRAVAIYRKEVYAALQEANRQAVRRGGDIEATRDILSKALRGLPERAAPAGAEEKP